MTARANAREARLGHAGLGKHEEAAVLDDQTDAFGPLAVGPADVGVAVGEFECCGSPHEECHPAALMVDCLDQSAAHRAGVAQIVFLLQHPGGAWPILAAQGGHFQLPEHHAGRFLGKHNFEFRVHVSRN